MKIAVRLDDITPDMDWERFLKFKELLDCYQIQPLIGVVPDNRDENLKGKEETGHPEFWDYIGKLKDRGWTIAMHGCRHTYTTKKGGLFPLNHFSEFAGISYERQLEMLLEGKRLLREKGIETDLFMAPAHSYDKNTLKALKQAGFRALTDGFGSSPYKWQDMIFYPISFQLKRSFRRKDGYTTMVVHTGTVSDKDLERYHAYFQKEGVDWISYQEYLTVPALKRGLPGRMKEFLLAITKHLFVKLR